MRHGGRVVDGQFVGQMGFDPVEHAVDALGAGSGPEDPGVRGVKRCRQRTQIRDAALQAIQHLDEHRHAARCRRPGQPRQQALHLGAGGALHFHARGGLGQQRRHGPELRQPTALQPVRRKLQHRGSASLARRHATTGPQMRGLAAHQHQVTVEEGLHAVAHPAQALPTLNPRQLEVPVAMQPATEGGQCEVHAAQRLLGVMDGLAGDPNGGARMA